MDGFISESENARDIKKALRQKYKSLRSAIPPEVKSELDRKICDATLSLASVRFADTILMYAPTDSEIDIMPIAVHALKCGKRVAFPRCNTENCTMDFKYVSSPDDLIAGEYSIREPSADAESVGDFSRSVCIVPALLFDFAGYRVGYGKGYYDRFLHIYPETKLGLIYSDFILDSVPRGRFDRKVDILVCEKGVKIAGPDK